MLFDTYCADCGDKTLTHLNAWIDSLTGLFSPKKSLLPARLERLLEYFLDKFLELIGAWTEVAEFVPKSEKMQMILAAASASGLRITMLKGPFGETEQYKLYLNNKTFRFEGMPLGEVGEYKLKYAIDDKYWTKQKLIAFGFPACQGKKFNILNRSSALKYALRLPCPVVVKPVSGTFSRHVFLDIQGEEAIINAINSVCRYSPSFIVEEFIAASTVFRATVIDKQDVFVAKCIPAQVIGDGISPLSELINHSEIVNKGSVIEELRFQSINIQTIPKLGEHISIHKDPFMRYGATYLDITGEVDKSNLELFRNVATKFDLRVVGIDFLAKDLSKPWNTQKSAVLELNSCPSIELNKLPNLYGIQPVAQSIITMVKKHYK